MQDEIMYINHFPASSSSPRAQGDSIPWWTLRPSHCVAASRVLGVEEWLRAVLVHIWAQCTLWLTSALFNYILRAWLNLSKPNPDVHCWFCLWFACFFAVWTKLARSDYVLLDRFLEYALGDLQKSFQFECDVGHWIQAFLPDCS